MSLSIRAEGSGLTLAAVPQMMPAHLPQSKEGRVLVDHRTYTLKPGTLPAQLALYEKHGFVPQTRHLGSPLAFLIAESGELNTYVHLWAYEDAADRARRRAAMQADPEWKEFLAQSAAAGNLVHQRTSLMIPASFAPIKR